MDPAARKPPGRNDPCHCGSGRKYKQCCLDQDEAVARDERARAQANAEPPPAEDVAEKDEAPQRARHHAHGRDGKPALRGGANTRGVKKASNTRKVGGS